MAVPEMVVTRTIKECSNGASTAAHTSTKTFSEAE